MSRQGIILRPVWVPAGSLTSAMQAKSWSLFWASNATLVASWLVRPTGCSLHLSDIVHRDLHESFCFSVLSVLQNKGQVVLTQNFGTSDSQNAIASLAILSPLDNPVEQCLSNLSIQFCFYFLTYRQTQDKEILKWTPLSCLCLPSINLEKFELKYRNYLAHKNLESWRKYISDWMNEVCS